MKNNKNSFTKYNDNEFDEKNHNLLFELCNKINCNFIMSNSDNEIVKKNFDKNNFLIKIIECKRNINSKKPNSKNNEVLITNFFEQN